MGEASDLIPWLKIKVIGMGKVGSTISSHLIASDLPIARLYIVDSFVGKATGEEYDLKDMVNVLGKEIKVSVRPDMTDADIYIITAGVARRSSREEHDYAANRFLVRKCLELCNPEKPVIIVTNPYDRIVEELNKEFPLRSYIGAGYRLDASRLKAYNIDPERIATYILDSKGHTAFGITAEVLNIVRFLCYGATGARSEQGIAPKIGSCEI